MNIKEAGIITAIETEINRSLTDQETVLLIDVINFEAITDPEEIILMFDL